MQQDMKHQEAADKQNEETNTEAVLSITPEDKSDSAEEEEAKSRSARSGCLCGCSSADGPDSQNVVIISPHAALALEGAKRCSGAHAGSCRCCSCRCPPRRPALPHLHSALIALHLLIQVVRNHLRELCLTGYAQAQINAVEGTCSACRNWQSARRRREDPRDNLMKRSSRSLAD